MNPVTTTIINPQREVGRARDHVCLEDGVESRLVMEEYFPLSAKRNHMKTRIGVGSFAKIHVFWFLGRKNEYLSLLE